MGSPGRVSDETLAAMAAGELDDPVLEAEVAKDPELCARLEAMRSEHDLLAELGDALRSDPGGGAPALDEQIEGYRLDREIYRGGQGVVLAAYQESTKREVAVKLMLDGALASKTDQARFDREVELAAQLRHPNIVTVHESGRTRRGRRYVSMELVDGVRLDEACRELCGGGAPKSAEQVAKIVHLFVPICDAIAYAHRLGVIHRDLKPGNVLVTGDGRPVVLDFGIAKLAGSREGTTKTGDFVGTLSYAAPEQLARSPELVDTRADVYAIGVMLFECLTGSRPGQVEGMSLADSVRAVTEQDAPRASGLNGAVSRDLDAILRRALERDPARRYQSVHQLRDELNRMLAGEVVRAREGERLYLASRFVRKRKAPIAVGVAILGLGVVGVWFGYRANIRAAEARGSGRGMKVALDYITGIEYETREEGAGAVLDTGDRLRLISEQVDKELGEYPRYETGVRTSLGLAFLGERDFEDAERELREALRLAQSAHHGDSGEVADALHNLGRVLWFRAKLEEAEQTYRDALAMRIRLAGRDNLDVAREMHHLAATLHVEGKFDESEALWHEVIRIRRNLLEPNDPDIANSLLGYGHLLREAGRMEEAAEPLREALGIIRSKGVPNDWRVARVAHELGACLFDIGEYDEGERLLRESLAIKKAHPDRRSEALTALQLSRVLLASKGVTAEGRGLCEGAVGILASLLDRDHPDLVNARMLEARYMLADGDGQGALAIMQEAPSMLRKRLGENHWQVGEAEVLLSESLFAVGRRDEAHEAAARGVEILAGQRPEDDKLLIEARGALARTRG
ncbi:MAG: serine/threonine-protein kinase [Phycisphaerales bacterium]